MASTITAPTTAPIRPAPSPTLYQPTACPRNVARKAPTIPKIVVRTNPDGSLGPGMRNFAITPATKPMRMVQMMPMIALSWVLNELGARVRACAPSRAVHLTALDLDTVLAQANLFLHHCLDDVGADANPTALDLAFAGRTSGST